MSVSRIFLCNDKEEAEVYDEDENDFRRLEKLEIRAEDREEAEQIAEHVAEKFGEVVE